MKSKFLVFIIVLSLMTITLQEATIFQAVWYHRKVLDTTTRLDTHYMGLRNFQSQNERDYFLAEDIKNNGTAEDNLEGNPIRTMLHRDNDPVTINNSNLSQLGFKNPVCKGEKRFDRQFSRFLINFDLKVFSSRSFFVLEDLTDKLDIRQYARDCEVYFSVIYYKSKKDALAAFTAAVKDTTRKVALGGKDGIENCTDFTNYQLSDINHFLYKFTNPTCQVRFGMLGEKFNSDKKIMILPDGLEDTEVLNHISLSNKSSFNYEEDITTLTSCAIEDFTGETLNFAFVPSEFYYHCREHFWNSRTYNVCNNDPFLTAENQNSTDIKFTEFYRKVGFCNHLNNKYLKIEKIDFSNYLPDTNAVLTELFNPTTATATSPSTIENEVNENVNLQTFIETPSNVLVKSFQCKCEFTCHMIPTTVQQICDDRFGNFTIPCGTLPGPDVRDCGTKCTPTCALTSNANQGNTGYLRLVSSLTTTGSVDTSIEDQVGLNHSITISYEAKASLTTPTGKGCCDDNCAL